MTIPPGFPLQWPTLPMFPVLLLMHARFVIAEEAAMRAQFGGVFERHPQRAPRFVPYLSGPATGP